MRGCNNLKQSGCTPLDAGAVLCAQPRFHLVRTAVQFLAMALAFGELAGCSSLRSRLGLESTAPPAAQNVAPQAVTAKPSEPRSVVQTSGTDRVESPLPSLDIPRDAAPKNQAATQSTGNQPFPIEIPRDAKPKMPALPAPGSTPAKLPASFDLSSDSAPKSPASSLPVQGLGAPSRENSNERMAELSRMATERYENIDSYMARFRRREVVGTSAKPEELMLIKFRKNPWSVYFKWLGTEGHGREALFAKAKYENKLHTLLAAGDMPLMPAGKRLALSPDNVLVRNNSRHSIHEAGFGNLIGQFANLVAANAKGDTHLGTLRYLGPIKRPEFDQPCEAVEQIIPPGSEPGLAKGGRRLWVFDSATGFPILAAAHDDSNKEVEYYVYDRIQYPVHLTDDDFNPDVVWRPRQ